MDEIEKLQSEIEELKKINAVKSDLISVSAHQLRTSLSAVKWTLKMFIDGDIGTLTNEQGQFIKKSYENLEQMTAIVSDMLTLNSTDNSEIILKFEKTDIVNLIEKTVLEFGGESKKKSIELTFLKPEESLPEINCNREMIRVLLQNLIENALKYNKESGKIVVAVKKIDKEIEISVKDSGIGISREDQNNIFQRFFRAENAKKCDPIGSGLGLYTIKKIVGNHRGKVSFKSTLGVGTTFFILLPLD
jgi:signal transduction histidine kinase